MLPKQKVKPKESRLKKLLRGKGSLRHAMLINEVLGLKKEKK